jgi:site-specific recombinase XerD
MTELRRLMIQAMTVRGMAPRTQHAYVSAVRRLAKHYRRSPDQLTSGEVQSYLARLIEVEGLSWSTCSIAANAFRFLYHVSMGLKEIDFEVPLPRQPQRLPEILSSEEVSLLFESVAHPKHRLALETIYACGLRLSEATQLKVRDMDRGRMTVRIEQGKGRKDRYVPLSKRLLKRLDHYWATRQPRHWVFEGNTPDRCLHVTAVQKAYTLAKLRAGIQKRGGVHALRHAYATHLIESGVDVLTVQRLLGHRSVSTTMRYFHLSQARIAVVRSPLDLLDGLRP